MAFKKVDGIIAISHSVKESLVSYLKVNAEKICVIYNGTPIPDTFLERSRNSTPRLVYVGRLVELKGVQNTLNALAKISKLVDFEFNIVGEGAYRETLERLTVELGLEKQVHFLGLRRDVPKILSESDIFIHMPICEEGFGITVVEAMAAGCICVCAAKGGVPEIISDGVDGYLVRSGSAEELSGLLERIIPLYLQNNCESIREKAILRASCFSLQNYSNELDAHLVQMLSKD